MYKAHDTRTRNSCELNRARNLYVCHTDLQQDISRASSISCKFLVRVFGASGVSRASVMGLRINNVRVTTSTELKSTSAVKAL